MVRIDLNDQTDTLNTLKQGKEKETEVECVSEEVLILEPGLEIELFKQRS